jgi:hypothetical protein
MSPGRWLFPMGAGVFTQRRWWLLHSCGWRTSVRQISPTGAQSRLCPLMDAERSR